MKPTIQVTTHFWELKSVLFTIDNYPPGGQTVESLLSYSILTNSIRPNFEKRAFKLDSNLNPKARLRNVTLKLLNHEARALCIYLSQIISGNHIVDDYQRSCVDYLRNKLMQALI